MAELLQDLAEEAFHSIPIADCGMPILECGMWNEIQNPHSEIQNRCSHHVRSPAGRGSSRPRNPGSVGHSTAARGRLTVSVEAIKHRHQVAVKKERHSHAADHHNGQRLGRLATDLCGDGRG